MKLQFLRGLNGWARCMPVAGSDKPRHAQRPEARITIQKMARGAENTLVNEAHVVS